MNIENNKIIYVPGMKPKPPAEDHRAMLWRCLLDGVRRADPSWVEPLRDRPDVFELAAWSVLFYHQQTSIDPDLPGIERLLELDGPEERDLAEAMHWHKRIAQFVYLLCDAFPPLVNLVANPAMKATLQDARRYFRNEDGRAAMIRRRVAEELHAATDAGRRIMLIGHSLGSVIAFDVLWELSRRERSDVRIDEFVTIGSPLGLNFARHRILGARERGERRYPDNIGRWTNLSAVGEMTSLDRSMADDFAPLKAAGLVESITDHTDLQTYFRGPQGLNVHKCYGYMANARTGRVIVDWLAAG
ncbi:MAG: hypothetical protein ACE5G3_04055 [Gammaproteobacteria bacterium]